MPPRVPSIATYSRATSCKQMQRLISVDWRATFGFLKKPDVNEGIYLTYNLLHKPALLGILGAVAGLGGYGRPEYMRTERILEYRRKLAGLRVAIAPIEATALALAGPAASQHGSDRGNFRKAVIKYTNTVGYANDGATLIVAEQTLLGPAYRTWLLLDDADDTQANLLRRLQTQQAEFVPYLGKNEFPLWWENVREWDWEPAIPTGFFRVSSIFQKPGAAQVARKTEGGRRAGGKLGTFLYFERLPLGFQKMGKEEQYQLAEFMLTDFELEPDQGLTDLLHARNPANTADNHVIQVF
jgi:CRISPR-associated protein Cas5h